MVPTFFPQEIPVSMLFHVRPRPWRKWVGGGIWVPAQKQGVECELARAEDENEKCGEKNGVRGCGGEFVGIGDDGKEGLAIGCDVSHQHIDREDQPDEPRKETNRQQNASDKFDGGDESCGETGSRKAEARKEESDAAEIVELAPAVLCELKTPIKSDEEQEERLEVTSGVDGRGVESANLCREGIHHPSDSATSLWVSAQRLRN